MPSRTGGQRRQSGAGRGGEFRDYQASTHNPPSLLHRQTRSRHTHSVNPCKTRLRGQHREEDFNAGRLGLPSDLSLVVGHGQPLFPSETTFSPSYLSLSRTPSWVQSDALAAGCPSHLRAGARACSRSLSLFSSQAAPFPRPFMLMPLSGR